MILAFNLDRYETVNYIKRFLETGMFLVSNNRDESELYKAMQKSGMFKVGKLPYMGIKDKNAYIVKIQRDNLAEIRTETGVIFVFPTKHKTIIEFRLFNTKDFGHKPPKNFFITREQAMRFQSLQDNIVSAYFEYNIVDFAYPAKQVVQYINYSKRIESKRKAKRFAEISCHTRQLKTHKNFDRIYGAIASL